MYIQLGPSYSHPCISATYRTGISAVGKTSFVISVCSCTANLDGNDSETIPYGKTDFVFTSVPPTGTLDGNGAELGLFPLKDDRCRNLAELLSVHDIPQI